MARRKGGNRAKSTVNARKTTLENAREKLRDDPGGTRDQQQQKQQGQGVNITNMEATTTTANTTTKYYNKTKLQNNNNHQQNKTSSTITNTNNKKTQQTTYREANETTQTPQMVETTPTQKKLTAKQAKAAAKLAAQQQQQQQQNAKSDTNNQQQQQQQKQNEASKKMITEKEAKTNVTNIPATTTKSNTTAINANNTSTTQQRITAVAATANNISNSSNSSSNINRNNNNSSNMNTSDNSMNNNIRDQQQQQQENSTKSDNQQQQLADNNTAAAAASSMSWNNSKYLHKKFKRLASTTENDALQEAEKLRKTSMSSASSSVSSPPTPPTTTTATTTQQHQQSLTTPAAMIKNDEHLTNGVLNKHETQQLLNEHPPHNTNKNNNNNNNNSKESINNTYSQNQVLLQLAQQQNVVVATSTTTEISNNNSNTQTVSTVAGGGGIVATSTTSSSTAGGGGRYKCPYCDLSCTKPSVLQKHIRAHTNERPYPCEICGIAFKTKSNLYKHCRSRSHAARQKGIEVSPDADDGLSDQDVDPELSNSSSEMLSRTGSPIDELSNQTLTQQPTQPEQHFAQYNEPQMSISASIDSAITSMSPASFSAAKPTFLQQQTQKMPLGSPAAGTLPPAAATMGHNNTAATSGQKQSIDYKPYKPKFHNASLYATAKEAAAAAAVSSSTMSPTGLAVRAHSSPVPQKDVVTLQKLPESPHPNINQHQHLVVASEQKVVVPLSVHLPPPPQQSPTHMPHHPSLSPSTQMKLNNHISTHQLQQMQQQQLQQMQSQAPHHLLGPPPPANAIPLPLAAYYLGQPPATPPAALLHPSAHMPAQSYYNPVFASLHMMTPQQQQQFHHQLQIQQQHLQQQQQQLQLTHSSIVAGIPPPPPTQSPHSQMSASVPQNHIKTPTPLSNANHGSMSSNNSRNIHHPKANTPTSTSTIVHPTPQNALHYLANAASVASVALSSPNPSINKNSAEIIEQQGTSQRTPTHVNNSCNSSTLLQTSANSGMQEVTLNKEKLNEHINKLISQNEAIVENKELLLQKKYPKTLNRSRSFTNNGSSTSTSANSTGSSQVLQTTTGGPPSESPTNAKLAQAIVQKQQMQQQQQQQQHQQLQQQYIYQQHQQQQQQLHKQRHLYHDKTNMEEIPTSLPLNGTSKHLIGKQIVQPQQIHPVSVAPVSNQSQFQQYRTIVTITPTQPRQQTHSAPTSISATTSSAAHSSMANVPLNLSAKTKLSEECLDLNKPCQGPLPQAPPPATPRKRHSIEQTQMGQSQLLTPPTLALNEASNSSNSNSSTPQPSTSAGKNPHNNSIIKNLLLNARGLAVPTGTGEDAVYICPLCSFGFRTAEELKLHNSTYCQGSNSSANSPASSPSHKYFRSNSMSLNMPDFKILSKNPLSLAKLAWSQLKTKPSNLVLNRLSASVANTSKNSSTHTTSATSTQPSSQPAATNTSSASGSSILSIAPQTKSQLPVNEIRFVDAPLPSPGPLLGKTPLVDYTLNESKSKSEEVIITKMHDDPMYSHGNMAEHPASKRLKFEPLDKFSTKRSSLTSGGEMQLLSAQELSKKQERYKRFTSSGGCMIPLSECDDVDKSPKMIRTPLLSGGSFQEVSPKKETKLPLPLMPGNQMTSKLSLGLASSNGPQHFQFPPINQITAFNPLTLGLTEKVIPYVPGIPGPNSLQPQLPQAPPTPTQQQKQQQQQQSQQQHLLNLPQTSNSKHLSRTASPNRNQTPSPMNMSTTLQGTQGTSPDANKPTFGGVQNVPSEFNRAPPSTNMRNVRNWQSAVTTLSNNAFNNNSSNNKTAVAINEIAKPLKSFNFMRMADNLSPRKNSNGGEAKTPNSSSQIDAETRHFNLDKMSREPLIIHQPLTNISKSLSPTNLTLTPLHVDTNVPPATAADNDTSSADAKVKSKFLRPTSLPLRPGTFTPKRHHGITPTANTLPLISPETPRPSKECVQLYLNGNSYTYLGLKCSTKTFYCTLNCPQPSYVQDMHKLSMYSMWQQCAENNPHPLGLKPREVMSLYDSRQKTIIFTMAKGKKITYSLVAAQQTVMTPFISTRDKIYHHQLKPIALKDATLSKDNKSSSESRESSRDLTGASSSNSTAVCQTLEGGYESHENYIYVRGRGRGKYVCSECGIRCKKPSMLKKHIRTHTDVRPYTCKHCNFSFKTKGNLTKHMQSKTHYKKCIELGLNPGPMPAEGDFLEPDVEFDQQSSTSAGGRTSSMGNGESDSDGDSSDNETESSNESDSARSNVAQTLNVSAAEDNKSHLEHEAARCLLTLSMTPPIHTQSFETSMANSQIAVTTVSPSLNVSSTPTPAIRRVISYTSPKPPFDYQKQEQYYSNPKEPKPKLNNSSATSFEAAPMDLTKPRAMDVIPAQMVSQNPPSFSSNPGPVQTQAQIRDVIFGVNKNESGFLKTMISISSKVGRNYADNYEENHHKLNEDMMLYDYRREQTLQYYKIKQTQLSRGMTVNPNVVMSNSTPTTSTAVTTSVSLGLTTVTSFSDAVVVSSIVTTASSPANEQPVAKKEVIVPLQLPKIEIVEPQETLTTEIPASVPVTTPVEMTVVATTDVPKSLKSSDESEETDEEPPSKKAASKSDEKPAHNANLPAAILQPGTTDFSGVLSGGAASSQGSNANQPTRTVIVGEDGFTTNNNEILPVHPRVPQISNADGRPVCSICSKTFQKQSQLVLHMNIHYMERKYKCDPCGVSFRTQGHLQKHERSEAHKNKVIMTSTFGVPTTSNPRPFECTDCKIAFRIHGHLAKHLRSKTHVQKLECLQKLPFGTYAEIERAGISLTEIDTSDCENSLISLRVLARKLIEKDPTSKLGSYTTPSGDNSNTGLVSQDSASEDGFTAAERAAATAIASLDNNSAANTPRRANSTSEDESIAMALNNNLKRRLPGNFSNGEESDKEFQEQHQDKRLRTDVALNNSHLNSASPTN